MFSCAFLQSLKLEMFRMNTHIHTIDPVYDSDSKILILGSFPSVASRHSGFYYGHHNNRFWKVISEVLGVKMPIETKDKKELLLSNHIALWDVIARCEIVGSSDSSIRNAVPNNVCEIIERSHVKAIFTNGNVADSLYKKYLADACGIEATKLPSTSPANAAYSIERLTECWKVIKDFL